MSEELLFGIVAWFCDLCRKAELLAAPVAHRKEFTRELVAKLPAVERQVITLRFGFDGHGEREVGEVASRLNLSPSQVRQVEARGLDRLRRQARGEPSP